MQTLTLSEGHGKNGPYGLGTFGWRGKMELGNGQTLSVKVLQDNCGYSDNGPREWDNLGTMVCWHNRYVLGDEQPKESPDDYWRTLARMVDPTVEDRIEYWEWGDGSYRADCEERVDAIIEKAVNEQVPVMLPLYLYDHGGITMRTTGFSCPWDSGQVGFIYATKEDLRKNFMVKRVTKSIVKRAERVLKGEVEEYDDFLTGNVFGYIIEITEPDTCGECGHTEHVEKFEDSCWGYYGDPRDYLLSEVNAILADFDVKVEF